MHTILFGLLISDCISLPAIGIALPESVFLTKRPILRPAARAALPISRASVEPVSWNQVFSADPMEIPRIERPLDIPDAIPAPVLPAPKKTFRELTNFLDPFKAGIHPPRPKMSQEERLANLPPNLRAGNGHELVPKPEVELLNPKISWQQIAFAEDPTFPPQWDEAKRQEFKTAQVTWRKALSFLDPISGGKRAISEIVDKKLFSIAKDSIHDNLYLDRGYLKALPEPVKPLIQRWLEDQTYGVLGMMCNARRSTNAIVKAFGDKIMQIAVSSDPKTNGNPRLYKQNLKGLELLCSIKNKVTS